MPDILPKPVQYLKPKCPYFINCWSTWNEVINIFSSGKMELLKETGPGRRFSNFRAPKLLETFCGYPTMVHVKRIESLAVARGENLFLNTDGPGQQQMVH